MDTFSPRTTLSKLYTSPDSILTRTQPSKLLSKLPVLHQELPSSMVIIERQKTHTDEHFQRMESRGLVTRADQSSNSSVSPSQVPAPNTLYKNVRNISNLYNYQFDYNS